MLVLYIYIYIYVYIYIYTLYNKTNIKRNILTIKIDREVGRAKDLSAPRYLNTGTVNVSLLV